MSDIYNSSEANSLIELGRQLPRPINVEGPNRSLVVPAGFQIVPAPFNPDAAVKSYVDSSVEIHELDSFTRYVKRFQNANTLVFLALVLDGPVIKSSSVTAIFDYHGGRAEGGEDAVSLNDCTVGRLAHRATYTCPPSVEWQEWSANSGKKMDQEGFAKFLEDHGRQITNPDGASILELVMNFEQAVNVTFESKIARQGGLKTISYRETDNTAKKAGQVSIPEKMELCFAVFRSGEKQVLEAKINFKVTNGVLQLWYDLVAPHVTVFEAVQSIADDIESETGIIPISGRPPEQK